MKNIFREYDIRGIADTDLTSERVWALGRALSDMIKANGESSCYVSYDARVSAQRLMRALTMGLEAGGVSVAQQQMGPTPLLYFCAASDPAKIGTKSGIMVTGSHNPPEYNGFKMVIGGKTLFGSDIQELYTTVSKYLPSAPKSFDAPVAAKRINRIPDYIQYCKTNLKVARKIKVVLDAGNGAGGELGVETYKALGCEVIPLFCEPDGTFPNHHPDPTVPKNLAHLIAKVKELGADLGIAFDGDGDRIGAVSASGKILFGDHLVLYFARDILAKLPGASIISEVKSSQFLYDTLAKWGAKPIMWKTGHSLIKAKLKETKAALAGEMSGHMFFADRFFGFDDAIYAGARLIEGLSQRNESLDQFLNSLPPVLNTPELRVDCADSLKFKVVSDFVRLAKEKFGDQVNDIDGARVKIGSGWGLVRASNTQPVLVMRFEAQSQSDLKHVRDEFAQILAKVDKSVEVPAV